MTALVLDASVALAWCLPDEADALAEQVLQQLRDGEAVVPAVWALEVGNAVMNAERSGRLGVAEIASILVAFGSLRVRSVRCDLAHSLGVVVPLARQYGLTTYDAVYLDLALQLNLPLATLDRRLQRAAKAAGVKDGLTMPVDKQPPRSVE